MKKDLTHDSEAATLRKVSHMRVKPSVRAYLADIGRKGGKAKSARKTEAARKNAKRPRPRRAA